MNWLVMQTAGEHPENAHLKECWAIQHALMANGQSADVWGAGHTNWSARPDFSSYNVILKIDNYGMEWVPDLRKCKGPIKIQWIIDLHYLPFHHFDRAIQDCDIVLHSTRSLMEQYSFAHPHHKHLWFPNGVDDRYFTTPTLHQEKLIEFGFVGNTSPARAELLKQLQAECKLDVKFAIGQAMIDRIRSMKIHFNKNISTDINYRTFETIGLGTCLMTNQDPDLARLGFVDRQNCLLYNTTEGVKDQLKWALSEDRWTPIAAAGYELSKANTYTSRIRDYLLPHLT